MANPNNLQLEFYVLSAAWLERALPYLQGSVEDFPEVEIQNAPLLLGGIIKNEHAVSSSSSDEEEDSFPNDDLRKKRRAKWMEKERQHVKTQQALDTPPLKPGLVLGKDYYLIGPHAWTVLSLKFGFDYALPRKCIYSTTAESKIVVMVYPHNTWMAVHVPASGRFSYEPSTGASAAPLVANDDDDDQEKNDLVSTKLCGLCRFESKRRHSLYSYVLTGFLIPTLFIVSWIRRWQQCHGRYGNDCHSRQ